VGKDGIRTYETASRAFQLPLQLSGASMAGVSGRHWLVASGHTQPRKEQAMAASLSVGEP
jgi:hypothetical protein